jgi:hypothetical protein
MKPNLQNSYRDKTSSTRIASKSKSSAKTLHSLNSPEAGAIAETSLKLFFGLSVSLVATISLVRLLPYHFAQSEKLTELRAQVAETEYRVNIKRQQLQKNFDSEQMETLMEEHSPRIGKDRVRVFLQQPNSPAQ